MTTILDNFLVLEGLDGAGTTTQAALIEKEALNEGIEVFATAEPTKGEIGLLIRRMLHSSEPVHPDTFALLYAADRNEHLNGPSGIVEQVQAGRLVVSDRYLLSSLAYQSVDSRRGFVSLLNDRYPAPALTIFVDVPVELCLHRLAGRGAPDRFENRERLERVRERYHQEISGLRDAGGAVVVVDGTGSAEGVFAELWTHVQKLPIFQT